MDAAVASIAAMVGELAQFAIMWAWEMAKAAAILSCGAIIIGVPLVAVYSWSGGSTVRYAAGGGVVILAMVFLPELFGRWHRRWRARNAAKS